MAMFISTLIFVVSPKDMKQCMEHTGEADFQFVEFYVGEAFSTIVANRGTFATKGTKFRNLFKCMYMYIKIYRYLTNFRVCCRNLFK